MVIKHNTEEMPEDIPLEEWLWITGQHKVNHLYDEEQNLITSEDNHT